MKMEKNLVRLLADYRSLLDSYVIEFFTEDHWAKLPHSWREPLSQASLKEVAQLLLDNRTSLPRRRVYPLSLLAFSATAHHLSLSRECKIPDEDAVMTKGKAGCLVQSLDHLFRRHVKPKKQHEIKLLGEAIYELSCRTMCKNVIDVGSGQGHLARYLAFHYGLNVTAVEAVDCHLTAATKFDSEVEKDIVKKTRSREKDLQGSLSAEDVGSVRHVETLISPEMSVSDLLVQMGLEMDSSCTERNNGSPSTSSQPQEEASCSSDSTIGADGGVPSRQSFILVGLHTCGDLAPTMFRLFSHSKQIVGLVSVGCCYMKLTCSDDLEKHHEERIDQSCDENIQCSDKQKSTHSVCKNEFDDGLPSSSSTKFNAEEEVIVLRGYPMSALVRSLPGHSLSYEAREVACHSLEVYLERCVAGEDLNHLKIHCHRAAVETILKKYGMKRAQVRISKRVSKLPFVDYAQMLVQSVGLPPLTAEELRDLSLLVDTQWKNVAKFFMLRLTLAPCVESLILLDRIQFLKEQGHCNVHLVPVFDPKLSPRNFLRATFTLHLALMETLSNLYEELNYLDLKYQYLREVCKSLLKEWTTHTPSGKLLNKESEINAISADKRDAPQQHSLDIQSSEINIPIVNPIEKIVPSEMTQLDEILERAQKVRLSQDGKKPTKLTSKTTKLASQVYGVETKKTSKAVTGSQPMKRTKLGSSSPKINNQRARPPKNSLRETPVLKSFSKSTHTICREDKPASKHINDKSRQSLQEDQLPQHHPTKTRATAGMSRPVHGDKRSSEPVCSGHSSLTEEVKGVEQPEDSCGFALQAHGTRLCLPSKYYRLHRTRTKLRDELTQETTHPSSHGHEHHAAGDHFTRRLNRKSKELVEVIQLHLTQDEYKSINETILSMEWAVSERSPWQEILIVKLKLNKIFQHIQTLEKSQVFSLSLNRHTPDTFPAQTETFSRENPCCYGSLEEWQSVASCEHHQCLLASQTQVLRFLLEELIPHISLMKEESSDLTELIHSLVGTVDSVYEIAGSEAKPMFIVTTDAVYH